MKSIVNFIDGVSDESNPQIWLPDINIHSSHIHERNHPYKKLREAFLDSLPNNDLTFVKR